MNQPTPNSPNQLMAQILEDALVNALMPIVERLDRIEVEVATQSRSQERNQQLAALNQKVQALLTQLASQQQSFNSLVTTLVTLSNGLNQLMENLEQWKQHYSQSEENLSAQINGLTHHLDTLIKTLTPLPEEMRFVGEDLNQRLDRQDRELELMSLAMKELAEELNKLALALKP